MDPQSRRAGECKPAKKAGGSLQTTVARSEKSSGASYEKSNLFVDIVYKSSRDSYDTGNTNTLLPAKN